MFYGKEFQVEKFLLPVFLIIAGLGMCEVAIPRWLRIVGGICGVLAGILMLV